MKKGIFVVIILVIAIAGIFGYRVLKLNKNANIINANAGAETNNSAPLVDQGKLKSDYEQAVYQTLAEFLSDSRPQNFSASAAKQKILDLTVPTEYKDLHLNLVLALDEIESGAAQADQAKIEDGLEKLEALKGEYGWIVENF